MKTERAQGRKWMTFEKCADERDEQKVGPRNCNGKKGANKGDLRWQFFFLEFSSPGPWSFFLPFLSYGNDGRVYGLEWRNGPLSSNS